MVKQRNFEELPSPPWQKPVEEIGWFKLFL